MPRDTIARLIAETQIVTPGRIANARVKQIVDRVVADLFVAIDELDVTPDEFWTGMAYLTELGQCREAGLLAPGLGFEHLLDVRMDEAEEAAGMCGGTPRTIEGPLFVAGAPLFQHHARLDDGSQDGERLAVTGIVRDLDGGIVADAIVDVWHADTRGMYSHFDRSQSAYNLRRRIAVDADGRYRFDTVMPSGYSCPPDGPTRRLLDLLGRHDHRPAHIHYMVTAPGFRTLTTQINIDGDEYLHDDFAFATRDDLIPPLVRDADGARITFDLVVKRDVNAVPFAKVERARAEAEAA